MRDDRFDRREQDVIDNVSSATNYIKGKIALELELHKKGRSVVSDSLSNLENLDNNMNNNKNLEKKGNVRVRTLTSMENTPFSNNNTVNNLYQSNGQISNSYYSDYNDASQYNNSISGAVSMLILFGVTVLIILVFIVSLVIMNYVGL